MNDMYNILTLNKIAKTGLDRLGENYTCTGDAQNPDAVLVRSASMHDMQFGGNLLAIARAGASTTSRSINARRTASSCSTRPARTQTL